MLAPEILWLDLQPSLYCFNCRLSRLLTERRTVRRWSFQHDPDEACTISLVHDLLRQTIVNSGQYPHLVAHGFSGIVASLFASQHPELIQSLTLLSVDTTTANQWTSHYHAMRNQLPCSRSRLLEHLTSLLFESEEPRTYSALAKIMAKCLDTNFVTSSLVTHELNRSLTISSIPTLVINGENDFVVDRHAQERLTSKLKPGDRYLSVPNSRHFFHFHHPETVVQGIDAFLDMVPITSSLEWSSKHLISNQSNHS
ncbi:MAG: alpha/beta hydrolase [Cyanobacteriota bacterium]|nr:alpha/beta hydrolase [Cyanobacteriota bacterium]